MPHKVRDQTPEPSSPLERKEGWCRKDSHGFNILLSTHMKKPELGTKVVHSVFQKIFAVI